MYFFLFLLVAAAVIFLSIKLSVYAEAMETKYKIGGAFIGGILLASITSFPELVSSITAVIGTHSPELAIGDIAGSNLFNILIISVLDIIYIRHMATKRISSKYSFIMILLTVLYIILYGAYSGSITLSILNVGLPTICILIGYVIFLKLLSKIEDVEKPTEMEEEKIEKVSVNYLIPKFVLTSVGIILASIALTIVTHEITLTSAIGASVIGAFLLGITTSLPEVVTTATLFKYKNYTAGFSNILGSNMFNLFVLAVCDIITKQNLYPSGDNDIIGMTVLLIVMMIVYIFAIMRNKIENKILYAIPSLTIIILYIVFWYLQLAA